MNRDTATMTVVAADVRRRFRLVTSAATGVNPIFLILA